MMRDSRPVLRITEEGILNRTSWSSATLVPWEEIIDIRKTRRPSLLHIVLRDPQAYRKRQDWQTRVLIWLRKLLGAGDALPIYLERLDERNKEIAERILEMVEAREIALIREQKRISGT